jgi:RNA polymerase sigma-70 factor (ECF subfamily)
VTRSLVEQAQRGDRDAYERLAHDSVERLYRVASRILGDHDAADDAVQQSLVAIWRDLPSLRDPDRFEAWTYRIVVRYCRAETRRLRRLKTKIIDLSESMAGADGEVARVAERDELARAFARLSIDHRTVVVLHHVVGVPLAEIAEILGIPYGTVGSRLHHAKHALRAAFEFPASDRIGEEQSA